MSTLGEVWEDGVDSACDKLARLRMRIYARLATDANDSRLNHYGRKEFYYLKAKKNLKEGSTLDPMMVASYDELRTPVETYMREGLCDEHLIQTDFILSGPLHRDGPRIWHSHMDDLERRFLARGSDEEGNFPAAIKTRILNLVNTPPPTVDDYIRAQQAFIAQLCQNWAEPFNRYRSTQEGKALLDRLGGR